MRYNPHAPYIIGEEWVPIRQASFQPSQADERGYTFTIDQAATIVSGAFYVQDLPASLAFNEVDLIAVYPGDTEDLTGPIQSIVVPASAISVTGDVTGTVAGLLNPSDDQFVRIRADVANAAMGVQFDFSAYSAALSGKRIVDVKLLYTTRANDNFDSQLSFISIARSADISLILEYARIEQPTPGSLLATDFDSVNVFWTAGVTPATEDHAYPWRYDELALFDETAAVATKLQVAFQLFAGPPVNTARIGYAAMLVSYCEERRTLYGAKRLAPDTTVNPYTSGPNLVQLRTPAFAIPGSSAAGGYFVSHAHRLIAEDRTSPVQPPPTLYALRQLYEIPTMQAKNVQLTETVGETFTSERTDIVPYLTLHTDAAIVTGVHAYGQQIQAPVYGSITAVQAVNGLLADGAANGPFTQVRFYARRFGTSSGTLVLREGATQRATITEDAFDALPEIVDGWREITLDLDTDITFTSNDVNYTWEALGVAAGSRWEILGADGPFLAGAHASGFASYEPPAQGQVLELTWKGPNQLVSTEDDNADAVLIFSQDPPAVTGFSVVGSGCQIPVTGIGAVCDLPSTVSCVPTAVHGNLLRWVTGVLCDTYSREVSGTTDWGIADTGQTTAGSGGAAINFEVSDGRGKMIFTAANQGLTVQYSPTVWMNFSATGRVQLSDVPTGSNMEESVIARFVDANNFIQMRIRLLTDGTVTVNVRQVVGGVQTTTSNVQIETLTATSDIGWRLEAIGDTVRCRLWPADQDEPIGIWQRTLTTTLLSAGRVSVSAFANSSVTGPFPMTSMWDDLMVFPSSLDGGRVEVQRSDDLTDWQTIATVSPCVTGMCDLEARVGMESRYRIRTCNVLDFCGPWVTGAGTIAAPGVTIDGDGNGLLIFTSNRNPGASLAHTMAFERDASEDFVFPEAGFTQLSTQFGRDFFVAFRPLERGGEGFSRQLLINAMAIPPESLANMSDLRDLAWDDLPYICVRDELGNRWFANVRVPSDRIRRNRTLYYAQLDVIQVTDTAAPIEGGGVG